MPSSVVISGVCSNPPPLSPTGWDSGMNGVQFDGVTYANPTTITAATTASLIATTTWFTRLENFVPYTSMAITTSAMTTAGRSMTPSEAEEIEVGSSIDMSSSSDCR